MENRRKDGSVFPARLKSTVVRDSRGNPANVITISEDITGRRMLEDTLRHQAFYDPLTDLPNRLLFDDRLSHAFERSQRNPGVTIGVMYLDLDRFKAVNDSLGHMAGDKLLVEVGRRLRQHIRTGDTLARLGGDEFAIIFEHLDDRSETDYIASRILQSMGAPFLIDGREVLSNVSIGIALSSGGKQSHQELLRDADNALYRAKAEGRGRYVHFSHQMQVEERESRNLEEELRLAAQANRLSVCYQPVYRLRDNAIIGVEALMRWENEERGSIPPDVFIPLAEDMGIINDMSEFLARDVAGLCRRLAENGRQGIVVSMNCSAKQFFNRRFMDSIKDKIQGLRRGQLQIEITESIAMDVNSLPILKEYSDAGVSIAIDDFGTGYSSFSQIMNLPCDAIKIDRSFIGEIDTSETARDIARAIITLSDNMDLIVIAEGVETEAQRAALLALGCDAGQGYLMARPMPEAELAALIGLPPE